MISMAYNPEKPERNEAIWVAWQKMFCHDLTEESKTHVQKQWKEGKVSLIITDLDCGMICSRWGR
jgi:hypothetical protein